MTTTGPSEMKKTCVVSAKPSTVGATALIFEHSSEIRWGVIHDGMLALKEFVPRRVINDDDARV